MRRELTIRCVSTGTLRTDGPDGARWELRDIWLELDGALAHVRIMETWERGQCTRDTTIKFDRVAVRQRASQDLTPRSATRQEPLAWLVAMAETMRQEECRRVSLWVRSMDPAALVQSTPVAASGFSGRVDPAEEEVGGPETPSSTPYLQFVAPAP